MQVTKCGKYISPHLVKYNERITINNKEITDKEMSDILDKISKKVDIYNDTHQIKVKEFEVFTTLAFIYFAEKECDFVVLETGLGGRYDCTNIASGMISVITDIGLDHMDILGNTVEEIAIEKAGIIKENSDTVIYPKKDITDIIRKTCREKNNTLHLAEESSVKNYSYNKKFQKFDYKNYKGILVNLKGKCQIKNSLLAIECIDILKEKGYEISEKAIKNGLKTIVHKARFETLSENPTVIFDGGHNEDAIKNLKEMLDMYYPNEKRIYIISMLKTKDYKKVVNVLASQDTKSIFIFTSRK